jgi:hypothetical protein
MADLQIGSVSAYVTEFLMTDIYAEPSCTPTEWHRQRTLHEFLATIERNRGPRPVQFIESDPVRVSAGPRAPVFSLLSSAPPPGL